MFLNPAKFLSRFLQRLWRWLNAHAPLDPEVGMQTSKETDAPTIGFILSEERFCRLTDWFFFFLPPSASATQFLSAPGQCIFLTLTTARSKTSMTFGHSCFSFLILSAKDVRSSDQTFWLQSDHQSHFTQASWPDRRPGCVPDIESNVVMLRDIFVLSWARFWITW